MKSLWQESRGKLIAAMESGSYESEVFLPPITELADTKTEERFGSVYAVREALKRLLKEGYVSQDREGCRYTIVHRKVEETIPKKTYEDGIHSIIALMREADHDLSVCLCENWLPATFETGKKPTCDGVEDLKSLVAFRKSEFKKRNLRVRILVTWPRDTGSLLSRIWTRRRSWQLSENQNANEDLGFFRRATMVAREVLICNSALKELAEKHSDVVELHYMLSWPSCPMVFAEPPFDRLLAGMYHTSRSSYESPADLILMSNLQAISHREEFEDQWDISLPYKSVQNDFVESDLTYEIYERFQLSYKEFFTQVSANSKSI